ncbi:MAG: GNAT family N-acetyltransferase [Lachnospiraceae bacterium]|nr:GNAT family N-acetyltransferase [Lachnospiraceae bacterium]
MKIETERLIITEFDMSMAESVHINSLDEDNRRFVPDEVFETVEEAAETVEFLMGCYTSGEGPLVYPVLLKNGTYIGYVQAVPFDDGTWEIGYHIGGNYTKQGYATEAVTAFLPIVMKQIEITEIAGICLAENVASVKVMERSGFTKLYEGNGNYQGQERAICKFIYTLDMTPKDLV